jgi:hypothetical protein
MAVRPDGPTVLPRRLPVAIRQRSKVQFSEFARITHRPETDRAFGRKNKLP